jgi:hypothetical protein
MSHVPSPSAAGPDDARPADLAVVLTWDQLVRLLQVLPDCESAILLAIGWLAAANQQADDGTFAGRPVARLSGVELARMTGRPLRTVRHALAVLTATGAIRNERTLKGRTAIYALPSLEYDDGLDHVRRPGRGGRRERTL